MTQAGRTEKTGIHIYDSFGYPEIESMFMTSIFARIDPEQYWQNRPLLINRPEPQLYDAINLTPEKTAELIDNEMIDDMSTEIGIVVDAINTQKEEVVEVIEEMKEFDIPPPTVDFITLEWWPEADGQTVFVGDYYPEHVVVTVGSSMLDESEYTATSGTELILHTGANHDQFVRLESALVIEPDPVSFSGYVTVLRTPTTEDLTPGLYSLVDLLPTEEILSKLAVDIKADPEFDNEAWVDLLKDYGDTYEPIGRHMGHIVDIAGEYTPEISPEEEEAFNEAVEEAWKPMGELQDEWYGIPLINLGPTNTPTKESIIVNINQKNDWRISVTNLTTTGLDEDKLVIDKQVPPGKKFMVGIYVVNDMFGLILRIEGDPKIYKKEIQVSNNIITKVLSYGVDSEEINSLQGNIYDVLFWEQPSNFNHNVPSPEPNYPNDGWVYDFRKTDIYSSKIGGNIDGNTIRPITESGPTARAGFGPNNTSAKFKQLVPDRENIATGFPGIHPWFFIYESYLDNFFCRNHLKQSSFSIIWHQWIYQYPVGIHSFVSDSVYSNYLSYDYNNFNLILEFNGRIFKERLTLPEKVWTQSSLRYDKTTGEITFTFVDLQYNLLEKLTFDIGKNLEFELISLFARFDKQEIEYVQSHRGLFGMVIIQESYKTDTELIEFSKEIKNYLIQYTPVLEEDTTDITYIEGF